MDGTAVVEDCRRRDRQSRAASRRADGAGHDRAGGREGCVPRQGDDQGRYCSSRTFTCRRAAAPGSGVSRIRRRSGPLREGTLHPAICSTSGSATISCANRWQPPLPMRSPSCTGWVCRCTCNAATATSCWASISPDVPRDAAADSIVHDVHGHTDSADARRYACTDDVEYQRFRAYRQDPRDAGDFWHGRIHPPHDRRGAALPQSPRHPARAK